MGQGKFWYRKEVGNPTKWEKLGKLQLDYFISQGLLPHHFVLDVGCGPLRGGGHFIRYLNRRHYFGIDNNKELLEAGRDVEVPLLGLTHKEPVLRVVRKFDLTWLGEGARFDYAMAQSLFTHLTPKQIGVCLRKVGYRLAPEGKFYATFNPAEDGKSKKGPKHPKRDELDWTYYPASMFEELADNAIMKCQYIGDWGHDLNSKNEQMMLCFTKKS